MIQGSKSRKQDRIIAEIKELCVETPEKGATIPEARTAWRKAFNLANRNRLSLLEFGLDQEPDWLRPAPGFDYSELPPEIAAKLKETALKIRGRSLQNAIEVGRELIEVKSLLKHGRFLKYLNGFVKSELGMSLQSAQNQMGVAQLLNDPKNAKFENIPVSGLYILASRSTPETALQTVREQLEAGRTPKVAEIAEIVLEEKSKISGSKSGDAGSAHLEDTQPHLDNISIEDALAGTS
jgi:hypothetical protein